MEMTAVDFLRTKDRMCKKLDCVNCPLSMHNNKVGKLCHDFIKDFPNSTVLMVQKWGEDNPRITNNDKFKEVFGDDLGCGYYMSSDWWQQEYKGGD